MNYKFLLVTLIALMATACEEKVESQEILFVCTHGAARSPIAAAYFNRIAKEKNLNYHAVFRGTEPDKNLSKETISGLTKDRFEVRDWRPSKVSKSDIEKAHKIITFDCTLPQIGFAELDITQWNGTPSISKDYNDARSAIEAHVIQLTKQLIEK